MGRIRRVGFTAVAAVALAASAWAVDLDISGTYSDSGTALKVSEGKPGAKVSLYALVNLAFEPDVARILEGQAQEARLTQSPDNVHAEFLDKKGERVWQGQWPMAVGKTNDQQRIAIRFKATGSQAGEYFFFMRTLTSSRMLEVQVQRVDPTLYGPAVKDVGTYLFPRVSD